MPLLVKLDVAEHAQCHEEDKSGIEEDQSSLSDVRIVEEDEAGSEDAGWKGIARFGHDEEDDWNGQCTQQSRESSEGDIWHPVVNVRVANVVEEEVAIETNKPADEGEQ